MMVYKKLPEAYKGKQISRIELERSKILSRLIKTIQAILAVLLLAAGCLFIHAQRHIFGSGKDVYQLKVLVDHADT